MELAELVSHPLLVVSPAKDFEEGFLKFSPSGHCPLVFAQCKAVLCFFLSPRASMPSLHEGEGVEDLVELGGELASLQEEDPFAGIKECSCFVHIPGE